MLTVLENRESGCYSRLPASFAYYTYTATLPTPVSVVAGQRYWLMVRADIGDSELMWGWRGGSGGDGKSLLTIAGHFWPTDMAFSLSR
jgi:hypothetical protein